MRVLALVESADHVCCRYRLRAFGDGLRALGVELAVEPLARGVWSRLGQARRCRVYDSVLIQRRLLPSWHLDAIRRHSRHLAFDFDDAVMFRDSYDPRGPHSPRRLRRFAATVRACDAVIAGNEFLAEQARAAGAAGGRVRVIPTCLEPAAYGPPPDRDPPDLRLVWIGSSSTLQGLEQSRGLWDRVGSAFPDLKLRVICDRFPDLGRLRIEPVPWRESAEIADLKGGDIGLGWVPDDLWSRGKCGLKVLQYLAAGLPVVANPVGVHPDMVRPGETGFLATTEAEWLHAIGKLFRDPDLRRAFGGNGRTLVERRYAVAGWTEAVFEALNPGGSAGTPHSSRSRSRVPLGG